PLEGVRPLSPTLDVVGPMGRDVAAVVLGMDLVEPGFAPVPYDPSHPVARLRVPGVDPAIDAAVDDALRRLGPVADVTSAHYEEAATANGVIVSVEGWRQNGHLLGDPARLSGRIHRRIQQMRDVAEAGMLD